METETKYEDPCAATPLSCDGDVMLLVALNDFYAWFKAQDNMPMGKTTTILEH